MENLELPINKYYAQQAVGQFFEQRKTSIPSQTQCDEIALSIVPDATAVRIVYTPGFYSYTVICTSEESEIVVSFREAGSELSKEVNYHGMMSGADPPLSIYAMSHLTGFPYLSCQQPKTSEKEALHFRFIEDLAKYVFCTSLVPTTKVSVELQAKKQAEIRLRLVKLRESPSAVSSKQLSELEDVLPILFSQENPQVFTHGWISEENILINEHTYKITGLADWSFASVLPFGMELDTLLLFTGWSDLSGWHNYTCQFELREAFWEEFWASSGVEGKF